MIINKSGGQSLKHVGLYLKKKKILLKIEGEGENVP